VRVIAATFKDDESADRALEELRAECDVAEQDAELAPLGAAGMESDDSLVLAGRVPDDRTEQVRELVARHGGTVVTEVDAAITGMRWAPPRAPPRGEDRPQDSPRRHEHRAKREASGVFF
jgi:hypothetical protein